MVVHVTRDTTFKVKGQGQGGILWQPPAQLVRPLHAVVFRLRLGPIRVVSWELISGRISDLTENLQETFRKFSGYKFCGKKDKKKYSEIGTDFWKAYKKYRFKPSSIGIIECDQQLEWNREGLSFQSLGYKDSSFTRHHFSWSQTGS